MLTPRAHSIIVKALRQGLIDRKVIETNFYDWRGVPQPHVAAQLTREMILDVKGGSETILERIEIWLNEHGHKLKQGNT
jgi:hypothetical protein